MTDRIAIASLPRDVIGLCARLREHGRRGWIVGGCVRDRLLGREVNDWDICTDARPNELLAIFPRAIPTGIEHGTVTVVVDKRHYEVTTLRGEGAYTDGRRPDSVEFVDDLTADLARRDFTCNAIALDPSNGQVIDPFGGQGDLALGILRAVGVAIDRFSEDGLRVLRAARFVATLGLELDPETERAIAPTLDTYRKVSAERIRDEWVKAMKARAPSRAFEVMRRVGILAITCPELLEGVGMEQNAYHRWDVWRHGMEALDASQGDAVLRLAALFHDIGKPKTRGRNDKSGEYTFYEHERVGAELVEPIALRLRFSNEERARMVHLVRHHLVQYGPDWSDAAVRRWLQRVGTACLTDLFAICEADERAKGLTSEPDLGRLLGLKAHVERVVAAGAALSTRDLCLNGSDLMEALGLAPGRRVGEVLRALLDVVINDPLENDRERLLSHARRILEGAVDSP